MARQTPGGIRWRIRSRRADELRHGEETDEDEQGAFEDAGHGSADAIAGLCGGRFMPVGLRAGAPGPRRAEARSTVSDTFANRSPKG